MVIRPHHWLLTSFASLSSPSAGMKNLTQSPYGPSGIFVYWFSLSEDGIRSFLDSNTPPIKWLGRDFSKLLKLFHTANWLNPLLSASSSALRSEERRVG